MLINSCLSWFLLHFSSFILECIFYLCLFLFYLLFCFLFQFFSAPSNCLLCPDSFQLHVISHTGRYQPMHFLSSLTVQVFFVSLPSLSCPVSFSFLCFLFSIFFLVFSLWIYCSIGFILDCSLVFLLLPFCFRLPAPSVFEFLYQL